MQDLKIAYIITDRDLNVLQRGGALGSFDYDNEGPSSSGSLLERVPELVGSEGVIAEILSGDLPRFQLEQVNRSGPSGRTHYLTLTLLPYQRVQPDPALLVVVSDATEPGRYAQTLAQQRNELALMRRDLAEANRQLDFLFRHYVPPEVANALVEQRIVPELGGELRTITVLFADLRNYTGISEKLSPDQVMELLNGYMAVASDAIAGAGGTVAQFMGDSVMALFNAPDDQPDHVRRAVQAGLDLQRLAGSPNLGLSPELPSLGFGVGINTGPALVGNTGARWRYQYTAIGDTVNVAARICSAARAGEALIGPGTYAGLGSQVRATPLAPMYFKGKSRPVAVYCVSADCGRTEVNT